LRRILAQIRTAARLVGRYRTMESGRISHFSGNGVIGDLAKNRPDQSLLNEAVRFLGKRTFLFWGFSTCGDDARSISTI
jgi:hypothetical protein